MRNYSQAISRTLDVQHLSLLIAGTLSELLESNRCALLLITDLENGRLLTATETYQLPPLPDFAADIIKAGGITKYVKGFQFRGCR